MKQATKKARNAKQKSRTQRTGEGGPRKKARASGSMAAGRKLTGTKRKSA
jgi:hypothetical protein